MTEHLRLTRFGAPGQDIGAAVAISIGAEHADVVAGIDVPGVLTFPPANQPVSDKGRAFLASPERWRNAEGATKLGDVLGVSETCSSRSSQEGLDSQ